MDCPFGIRGNDGYKEIVDVSSTEIENAINSAKAYLREYASHVRKTGLSFSLPGLDGSFDSILVLLAENRPPP